MPSMTLLDDFPEENLECAQEPPHEEELFFAVPHLHSIIAAAAPAEVEPADQAVDQIHSMAGSSRPMPLNIHDCQVGDVLLATQDVDISYRDVSIVQGCELRITRAFTQGASAALTTSVRSYSPFISTRRNASSSFAGNLGISLAKILTKANVLPAEYHSRGGLLVYLQTFFAHDVCSDGSGLSSASWSSRAVKRYSLPIRWVWRIELMLLSSAPRL